MHLHVRLGLPERSLSLDLSRARARPSSSPNQTLMNSWSPGEESRVLHTFCPPAGHRFFIFPMSSAVCVRTPCRSLCTYSTCVCTQETRSTDDIRTYDGHQAGYTELMLHACRVLGLLSVPCMHVFITRHPRPCSHADNLSGRGMARPVEHGTGTCNQSHC